MCLKDLENTKEVRHPCTYLEYRKVKYIHRLCYLRASRKTSRTLGAPHAGKASKKRLGRRGHRSHSRDSMA